jgi:hypothetical protein
MLVIMRSVPFYMHLTFKVEKPLDPRESFAIRI